MRSIESPHASGGDITITSAAVRSDRTELNNSQYTDYYSNDHEKCMQITCQAEINDRSKGCRNNRQKYRAKSSQHTDQCTKRAHIDRLNKRYSSIL